MKNKNDEDFYVATCLIGVKGPNSHRLQRLPVLVKGRRNLLPNWFGGGGGQPPALINQKSQLLCVFSGLLLRNLN